MRVSGTFSVTLTALTRDAASTFTQRVRHTGEQRLKSMLIEPVQRLPRYTLFIDNIVNLLPSSHPAISPLLKSKDIITDICALDSATSPERSGLGSRLRTLITPWPSSLEPQGRIIAAADYTELPPPFTPASTSTTNAAGVILLFADCVVVTRKTTQHALTARGLMAEVDRPSAEAMAASVAAASGTTEPYTADPPGT